MSLRNELKELLINVANLEHLSVDEISDDDYLFGEKIGIDSIDLLEFVVHLDKKYGIKIVNDQVGRDILKNIDSIALAIEKKAEAT